MKIQCFIFNWPGQTQHTLMTLQQLKQFGANVTVINSDESHTPDDWVNVGNDAFFTKQWTTACDLFDADVMFHIQADATYNDWQQLMLDAEKYYKKYNWGIYAPNVDHTWYDSQRSDLQNVSLPDSNLKLTSNPDCTCWFLHRDIIQQFKNLNWDWTFHQLGWGIDLIVCAQSYLQKRPILRDYNHTVRHPQGTNYNKQQAEVEMVELYNRCPPELQRLILIIRGQKELLLEYLK